MIYIIVKIITGIALMFSPADADQTSEKNKFEIVLKLAGDTLIITTIQNAINECSERNGGVVHFTSGTYRTGTLMLINNLALKLDKGALIKGNDKYSDYKNDVSIYGRDLTDIAGYL